jgi:hypothetical protein
MPTPTLIKVNLRRRRLLRRQRQAALARSRQSRRKSSRLEAAPARGYQPIEGLGTPLTPACRISFSAQTLRCVQAGRAVTIEALGAARAH